MYDGELRGLERGGTLAYSYNIDHNSFILLCGFLYLHHLFQAALLFVYCINTLYFYVVYTLIALQYIRYDLEPYGLHVFVAHKGRQSGAKVSH